MTAVAMSNYQLGDLLGRGASGQVYRALNFLTGETVAIKSVSLLSLPPSSLPDIMSEIDLLKNLNHRNIVKYKGFARDKDNLFIVLEYCENGSLQSILKKFGKFPESLVAVYVSQVLEGLIYLHEQGVIHRDIKGANILTNKDGSVKLADFGVSSRATTPALDGKSGEENDNEVVGSPYWMAPEVIEQSGASTASDIWSVGCVVVELLEGKPPYGDLAPMQALWRIVQDESMRVPEGASPVVKDFLYHCFQKDPNLRISAKKLLRHPWMMSAKRNLNSSPPPAPSRPHDIPPTKPSQHPNRPHPRPPTPSGHQRLLSRDGETVKAKKPMTVYDEAVQRVQEWNEALNASPKVLGTMKRIPTAAQPSARKLSIAKKADGPGLALLGLPSRSSAEAIAASQAASGSNAMAQAIPVPPAGNLLQKNLHVSDVLNRAKEQAGESWDADFAVDVSLAKLHHRKEESSGQDDANQNTVRPSKSPVTEQKPLPKSRESPRMASVSQLDDYSDLATGEELSGLQSKLAQLKLRSKQKRGIMRPDDLRKSQGSSVPPSPKPIGKSGMLPPPIPLRSMSTPLRPSPNMPSRSATPSLMQQAISASSSSLALPHSPRPQSRSPPGSRSSSLRGKSILTESQRDLQKYTEKDDEDYDDMIEGKPDQSLGSLNRASLQLTKRSNKSWSSDEMQDPFAEIDDDFSIGDDDMEAQLLRDKRATLCASVNKIVDLLEPSTTMSALQKGCDELLAMFESAQDMGLESHFVSAHGMLAVLELLESRLSRDVAVRLLRVVNTVVISDVDALESFCLVGGIPVIIPFTSKKHHLDSRLEASIFIQQLTRSALTLQMFISCRGLRILVEMLDEDYSENKTLILSSLEGIGSVFDLQSPTPRNDFCRMFVREGILDPLSTALLAILRDKTITDDEPSSRAIGVLLLFCQVAQADTRVRDAFATRMIMTRLLKACDALPRKLLVVAIKAIKHLSTSPSLIEVLQNSNAMDILVDLLGNNVKGAHGNEICSHIFQTIYSMTRLSKSRQEEAASSGIIPLLRKVIQQKSPLKQFALPILCDMANAGKVSRRLLWQNEGMKLYLDLLEDPYWRVSALDAILAWMADETARVEDVLLDKAAADGIVTAFVQATGVSFEGILDPLLKILRLSTSVTSGISTTPFFRKLSDALSDPHRAVVKLNLLRLTRVVCDNHPDRATLVSRFDLAKIVDRLARQDEAILVRELAKEIYPSLLFGNDPPIHHPTQQDLGINDVPTRVLSTMRRTTSDNASPGEAKKKDVGEVKMAVGGSAGVLGGTALSPLLPRQPRAHEGHKRKISRSQLKDVHWQTDENGRLKSFRSPSGTAL